MGSGEAAFAPDAPGIERLRAILFTSEATARALIAQFPEGNSLDILVLKWNLQLRQSHQAAFYTSDVSCNVVEKR